MRRYNLFMLLAALVLPVSAAYAVPMTFVGTLSGANEIPPTTSLGTGFASVVLDPTAETIQVNVTFSGLGTPTAAAHIHCCLAFPFQPVNVGVATTVPAFPGFPLGGTSGDYHSAVLSLLDPGTYNTTPNTGFLAMFGGNVSLAAAALISGIENEETYLNIHTAQFPGGEIRTFLTPAPEPTSLILLASAFVGFGLMRHRKLTARR